MAPVGEPASVLDPEDGVAAEHYRSIFREHPVPMWVYDPVTLRFLDVNEAAVSNYGYSRSEFLSMTIRDIRPREDVAELEQAVVSVDPSRNPWRHRTKDGTIFWAEVVSRDLGVDESSARLVVARNVSEQLRAEADLRRSFETERAATTRLRALDDMKNMFLSAVSHELRTPLAAIVGSATTLDHLGVDLTSEDQRDLVRAMLNNAVKLQRMLADLLDLDRLGRGTLRPRRAAAEVGDLIRRVVAESDFVQGRRVEVQASAMVLPVDAPKVERIVENLLANAAKYSPPGTPIWVRVTRVPEGAVIAVEDLGPGVPEEMRDAIFEPFQQGPNASLHSPGVGIGLALVARFAELHGGRAWWEERAGGGSSFRFLLRDPVAPKPE